MHSSSACHAYVIWEELGHSHFILVSHFKCSTTGNGHFKMERCTLVFVFSIQSSVYSATAVVKVSLSSTWMQSTVSFHSMQLVGPYFVPVLYRCICT